MALELADVLDALIGDPDATQRYADFVLDRINSGTLLELACGTGALAAVLRQHAEVEGLDLDLGMLAQFRLKNPGCVTHHRSMTHLDGLGMYAAIVCFGDSVNYLLDETDLDRLFEQVEAHLNSGGVFLFDLHTEHRLDEFEQEYIEEGWLGDLAYQWTIQTLPDQRLDHQLTFYEPSGSVVRHQVVQRVYPLEVILARLKRLSWSVSVYSDFVEGRHPNAEKYMLVCTKERT